MTALTRVTQTKWMTTSKFLALGLVLGGTALFAQAPPFKRTMLHQKDLSIAGHEVVLGKAEFPKGTSTGKHTHPGEESSYVSEGTMSIVMQGETKTYKAGESFFIPAGAVHDAINIDAGNSTVIANYIVEKGKPLTTPVK
jgi:quercetin dioxygenase-like cupin family protein